MRIPPIRKARVADTRHSPFATLAVFGGLALLWLFAFAGLVSA